MQSKKKAGRFDIQYLALSEIPCEPFLPSFSGQVTLARTEGLARSSGTLTESPGVQLGRHVVHQAQPAFPCKRKNL